MKADALLVIIVIVFIFVAWVATGGPTHPISQAGLFITPVTRTGEESQGYQLLAPANPIDTSSYPKQIPGGGTTISSGGDFYTRGTSKNASTYGGQVYLEHSILGPSSGNPNQEYVSVINGSASTVTITGWRLESKATGGSGIIPAGTALYRSGTVNTEKSIALAPGDKAIVGSGRSPVGEAFRENMCSGYLAQYQAFTPELTQECPTASADVDASYHGSDAAACSAFAASIPRCAVVTSSSIGGSCNSFLLSTLNYNGCVALHQKDPEFALPTWHVYLNRNLELFTSSRETITLYDANGKIVDSFSY
jgi:hypothetical protein